MPFPNITPVARRRVIWFALALGAVVPLAISTEMAASADDRAPRVAEDALSPEALREQVAKLVERLASTSRSERVIAQNRLLELGPAILPWIPAPDVVQDPQVSESLRRLRTELEQRQARESLQPETVTLQGRFPLAQVLEQIAGSTGNPIDVHCLSGDQRHREITVDFDTTPFWQAILTLADELGLRPELSQEGRAISLKETESEGSMEPLSMVSGACLVRVWPAESRSVPGDAGRDLLEVRIDLLLEPRLHAVFLQYRLNDFELQTVGGETLQPFTPGASYERPLVGGIGATLRERFLSTSSLEGQTLRVSGRAILRTAAIQETFRFPVVDVPRPVKQDRGGVTAKLHSSRWGTLSDGNTILKARLSLLYDQAGPEFESHRAGQLYQNAWLETGTDHDRLPAEVTLLRQLDRGAELELRFENVKRGAAPKTIVYRAPRQFANMPVVFGIEGVPVTAGN